MKDDGVGGSKGRADSASYGGAIMSGVLHPDKMYMKELEHVVAPLGWKIIKWMGVGPNRKSQVVIIPSERINNAKVNENVSLTIVLKEKIKKVGDEYIVYPKKGGKKLGSHKSKEKALAQLRAIEFSKSKREVKEASAIKSPGIKTIVAVYPGRFQPFGPHHKEVYEHITKMFKEVFIATSNKSGGDRHPMNFSQKKRHMQKMGINGSAIVQESQPYIPKGLLKKFDGESTAVVFVVGTKDKGRLTSGKYFKEYKKNYMRLEGYEKHGYTLEAPHVSVRVGGQEIDGTAIRKLLGSEEYDVDIKKKFFKKMFGYFDQKTFDLFTNTFTESLILEGGAYGHMAHPFDDYELTFGDLKSIIDQGLQGHLDKEESVTEKLDGQNIMVSVVDGEAKAARNKGDLKRGGMSLDDVKNKFKHHIPTVRNAFVYSMVDLKSSLERLSTKDQEELFDNGKNWANIEILYPDTKNVIDYDGGMQIILHGILIYNDAWVSTGEVKGGGKKLAAIINKLNKGIKTKFAFKGPNVLNIAKAKDYGKKRQKFFGALKKLQDIYSLKDTDEVSLYHQHFWLEYILAGAHSSDFASIPDNVLYPLMKRWAFSDKSYKMTEINKLKEDHPEFVDWVRATEKQDHAKILKDNMRPFEVLFFEVGAEILSNVSNWLAPNPSATVQALKKGLDKAAREIRSKKDPSSISKLEAQLSKISDMGDLSNLVPSEGLVFKYNGKIYKFTGYFAPINQITGLMKFSR
jgi:soluble cytochrome b562